MDNTPKTTVTQPTANSFFSTSGTSPTHSPSFDFSDYAEALRALQKAAAFNFNQDTILLTLVAVLREKKSNEFQASHAELGARMVNEIQPYARNMDGVEKRKRSRNLAQTFSRAWAKLKADQLATGLWFVKMRSGGRKKTGREQLSTFQVNLDAIEETIRLAKDDVQFDGNFRRRAFERAAEKVIVSMPRSFKDEHAPLKTKKTDVEKKHDEYSSVRRNEKMAKALMYKNYCRAVSQNIAPDEFKAHMLEQVALWVDVDFPNRLETDHATQQQELESADSVKLRKPLLTSDDYVLSKEHYSQMMSDGEEGSATNFPSGLLLNDGEKDARRGMEDAQNALSAFAQVGCKQFNVIFKDEATDKIEDYGTFDDAGLRAGLPELLKRNWQGRESLIVRARGGALIQVDDCSLDIVKQLEPFSFLTVETSHENFQAWIAMPEFTTDDELKAMRARLLKRLNPTNDPKQANGGAWGAVRWAGSINCKPERNGFCIRLVSNAYRIVSRQELEAAGLLAVEQPIPKFTAKSSRKLTPKREPFYDISLDSVQKKANGLPDRSAADVHYAKTALKWGFSESNVVEMIKKNSAKARERADPHAYAIGKVKYAAGLP